MSQQKLRFFFLTEEILERWQATNTLTREKQKTLFRSKCYPEDISKDKGKKANFRKSCKNFKIVDGYLTYKGKRRVTFDNDERESYT